MLHTDSKRCTHRQMSRAGLVQTRIDFWLISTFMRFDIDECEIHCGLKSDHSLVKLCFKLADLQSRGRGVFKFNGSLLEDKEYVEMVKKVIDNFILNNNYMED